jgi:hypothetical protein
MGVVAGYAIAAPAIRRRDQVIAAVDRNQAFHAEIRNRRRTFLCF